MRVFLGDQKKSIELATKNDIASLNPNLIPNSFNFKNTEGWYNWNTDQITLVKHSFWQNAMQNNIKIENNNVGEDGAFSPSFKIKPNTTYKLSIGGFADTNVSSSDIWLLSKKQKFVGVDDIIFDNATAISIGFHFPADKVGKMTYIFTSPNDSYARIRIDNNGSVKNNVTSGVYISYLMLQEYDLSLPKHSQDDFYLKDEVDSKIKALQDEINDLKK